MVDPAKVHQQHSQHQLELPEKELCLRGLECKVKSRALQCKQRRMRAVHAVLEVQRRQRLAQIHDPESIAQIYQHLSQEAVLDGHLNGWNDQAAVQQPSQPQQPESTTNSLSLLQPLQLRSIATMAAWACQPQLSS